MTTRSISDAPTSAANQASRGTVSPNRRRKRSTRQRAHHFSLCHRARERPISLFRLIVGWQILARQRAGADRCVGLRPPAPAPHACKAGNRVERDFRGEFRLRVLIASRQRCRFEPRDGCRFELAATRRVSVRAVSARRFPGAAAAARVRHTERRPFGSWSSVRSWELTKISRAAEVPAALSPARTRRPAR